MLTREYLILPQWMGSERLSKQRAHVREFFVRLLHITDGAGRFEADAALVRAVLYPRNLHNVSQRDVQDWMQTLHQIGVIELYTVGARAFGKVPNFRQRDTKRKVRYPDPEPDALELGIGQGEPPPTKPRKKVNRKEGEARDAVAPPPPPSSLPVEVDPAALLTRWRAAFPGVDIAAELERAQRQRSREGRPWDSTWFERHWLPACGVPGDALLAAARAERREATTAAVQAEDASEPDGWRDIIADTAYGPGGVFEVKRWAELSAETQAWVRGKLKGAA